MVHRITIAQVAEHANVSAMTVSNVLNGRPGASDLTRARVLESVRLLGYVPNSAARRLKSGRAGLVGVLLPDLRSQYATEILRGVADELAGPGLEALVSTGARDGRRLELLANGSTDALILVAPDLTQESMGALRDSQQPVVIVDPVRPDPPFPYVIADDYGGMRVLAAAVLAEGHREILYLQGEADGLARFQSRRAGFSEAISLAGSGARVDAIGSESTYEAALEDTLAYLASHSPTAIVAASDEQAFAAIDAVRSCGSRVPEDISVVGFGDLPQASQSFPGLTTVRRPLHEMGRIAVRTVLSRLDGVSPVQDRIELHTDFIDRGTLGPVDRSVHRPNG